LGAGYHHPDYEHRHLTSHATEIANNDPNYNSDTKIQKPKALYRKVKEAEAKLEIIDN
jgi:hypothetical protein